jgi:hypothetical protein
MTSAKGWSAFKRSQSIARKPDRHGGSTERLPTLGLAETRPAGAVRLTTGATSSKGADNDVLVDQCPVEDVRVESARCELGDNQGTAQAK